MWAKLLQLCPILCNPKNCSLSVSSVHGILQARILEWVATPSFRGFSQPRDSLVSSALAGRFLNISASLEANAHQYMLKHKKYQHGHTGEHQQWIEYQRTWQMCHVLQRSCFSLEHSLCKRSLNIIPYIFLVFRASLVAQIVKNTPAMWETWVQSWVGKIPGEGNGYPLQYSGLENSMDRGDCQTTVHGVSQSRI